MMKTYEKPVVSVDTGLAEGVYAASGTGTLTVTNNSWSDDWGATGGKRTFEARWSGIDGTITLNLNFNDTICGVGTNDASVQTSYSGKTATLMLPSTMEQPFYIFIQLDHGPINNLELTGFTYSVN